jgi:hypothetical protein
LSRPSNDCIPTTWMNRLNASRTMPSGVRCGEEPSRTSVKPVTRPPRARPTGRR